MWGITPCAVRALGKADVKAIIICETNPAHTLPNLNKVHKAMSNPDTFITVIEAFPDAVTLEYADLILPPASGANATARTAAASGAIRSSKGRSNLRRIAAPP